MKKLLIAVMLLTACASWAPTRKAQLRRIAEGRLRSCVIMHNCQFVKECIKESVTWCQENGMEKTCGTDGIFTDPIMCPRNMLSIELPELLELYNQ